MASKFRALEAGGLPYATIPSHYYIRSFSNTPTACFFDSRAALISLTYIVRFLLSNSRPVDQYVYTYASIARLWALARRASLRTVRRGVLRTFGDNH